MSTPSDLIKQLQAQEESFQALTLLWKSILPPQDCPDKRQFSIWLTRYGFDLTVMALQKTAEKFNTLLRNQNRTMDQDYMVRYASGCMVSAKREVGVSRG